MFEQQDPRQRGLASRAATAITLLIILTVSLAAVWLVTNDAASSDGIPGEEATFPRETGAGVCLRIAGRATLDPQPIVDALAVAAAPSDHLLPTFQASALVDASGPDMVVAVWPNGTPEGVRETQRVASAASCAPSGHDWTFAVTHDLLSDGADRLLRQAHFDSDWNARIVVSLHPGQSRIRTKLHFSGPFGVRGTCWVDESLVIDLQTGLPDVERKSVNDAGLPGLVACGRFEDELSGGGAGAQALSLFPADLTEGDQGVALAVTHVAVSDEAVVISGETR